MNNNFNYNNNGIVNGINLLIIKNTNEQLQDNINILENNQDNMKNNKYNDFMTFLNNNNDKQFNNKINSNLNPFQNDEFFNDSAEN